MKLTQQIEEDLNSALKAGEAAKVSVLRMIKSSIHNQQIANGGSLSDEDVQKLLNKEAKQRQESITSFTSGGREDMADKETKELEIIKAYLPKQMNDDELKALVEQAITTTGASAPADMGKVMAEVAKQAAGQADMGQVSQMVKDRLSNPT